MDIPFARWYEAIGKRRSRRRFVEGRTLEPDARSSLEAVCRDFRPFPAARAVLVTEPVDDVFRGVIGSYGKIKGAPAFVALVGDTAGPSVQEATGFTGEGIVLEAAALGLATCWVAAFRRDRVSSVVDVRPGERILAIVPVGCAPGSATLEERLLTGFGLTHRRLSPEKLVTGAAITAAPDWVGTAVRAARLAPSATNRQPWGFRIIENSLTVFVRTGGPDLSISKRLDCGIAMLHVEVAAGHLGVTGAWEFLTAPDVARFTPEP
jgi:hypothetical protein